MSAADETARQKRKNPGTAADDLTRLVLPNDRKISRRDDRR